MNEFDMLPDDSVMEMMARAYDAESIRREMLDGESAQKRKLVSPPCNGVSCAGSLRGDKIFSRIYYLEQDMIMALRQLHTVAPREYRDEIADCIKIKGKNSDRVLKCYYNATNEKLSYAPNLTHDRNYCRLIRYIERLEQKLLILLADSRALCVYVGKVFAQELSVSYILGCISSGCRRY